MVMGLLFERRSPGCSFRRAPDEELVTFLAQANTTDVRHRIWPRWRRALVRAHRGVLDHEALELAVAIHPPLLAARYQPEPFDDLASSAPRIVS